MALTKAVAVTEARKILKDPSAGTYWTTADGELEGFVTPVIRDLSKREPLHKVANLALVDRTRDVDVSGLTMAEILRLQWPAGHAGQGFSERAYKQYGTRLVLDLAIVPPITSGTLTGTLTFTLDSRNVTGSGTKFTTELISGDNGYLICLSSGTKYYQVAYITSDTALVLSEPFEETTAIDTVNTTKYRDYCSCVRVNYGAVYTIDTTTNAPTYMDDALVAGIVAYAMKSWVENYAQAKMADVTSKLASAATQIGLCTARVAQAVTDAGTFRTALGTDITDFSNGLAAIATDIGLAETDLVSARAKIPTVNVGGDEGTKLINSAATELEKAKAHIQTVALQSEESKMSKQYLDIVEGELKAVKGYLDQANLYINHVQQSVVSNYFVMSYGGFAKEKWQIYQDELSRLGNVMDGFHELPSRDL